MRRLLFVVFVLFLHQLTLAQTVKITRILDSNRFFTSDSQTISLANVDIPPQSTKDTLQALIARRAMLFAQNKLKGYWFTIKPFHSAPDSTNPAVHPVYLFKHYPLEEQFVNALYLEQGLGKYSPPADSLYSPLLEKAEAKAKQRGNGIWNPVTLEQSHTAQLVSVLYGAGLNSNKSTEFRSYGLHFETRSNSSHIGATIGYRITAEKGTGCCECDFFNDYDGYMEYLKYYRIAYIALSYQYFWKNFSVGWYGNLGVMGGGYCSEGYPFPFFLNGFNIESFPIHHYVLTVSYRDEFTYDYEDLFEHPPLFFGIGRRSGSRFAPFVWAGLSWADNHLGAAFKYEQRFFKKLFFQAKGGFVPNNGNVFMRLYTGYLIE